MVCPTGFCLDRRYVPSSGHGNRTAGEAGRGSKAAIIGPLVFLSIAGVAILAVLISRAFQLIELIIAGLKVHRAKDKGESDSERALQAADKGYRDVKEKGIDTMSQDSGEIGGYDNDDDDDKLTNMRV